MAISNVYFKLIRESVSLAKQSSIIEESSYIANRINLAYSENSDVSQLEFIFVIDIKIVEKGNLFSLGIFQNPSLEIQMPYTIQTSDMLFGVKSVTGGSIEA